MASPGQQPQRGGKRKGKAQYVQAKRARRGDGAGPRQLEPGLQGILITCNMNERKCVEEAYSLLSEYGDDLYGPEKVRAQANGPALHLPGEADRPPAFGSGLLRLRGGAACPRPAPSRAW